MDMIVRAIIGIIAMLCLAWGRLQKANMQPDGGQKLYRQNCARYHGTSRSPGRFDAKNHSQSNPANAQLNATIKSAVGFMAA